MRVPLLDLPAQYVALREELDAVWSETMASAGFIGGPRVARFEQEMAEYCGIKHAVACGNGTDALFLIMAALGVGKGDEVITTPYTFFATVECIAHLGATPVFVDIEPDTYNIDVSKLEAAITPRTKVILPVHIFGQCVDMDPLSELAARHGVVVVEDACQAIGATYKGRKAGSLAKAAAFSFFPSKNLGCSGDGGCITTDDDDLAALCRTLAAHGSAEKYLHSMMGVNSRLDALQAGILSVKLPHLDSWNAQRRDAAAYYCDQLAGLSGLAMPAERDYGDAVYHLFIVRSDSAPAASHIVDALTRAEIGSALYYPCAGHQQAALDSVPGYRPPALPVADAVTGTTFALPCFPGITRAQQDEVILVVRSALDELADSPHSIEESQ